MKGSRHLLELLIGGFVVLLAMGYFYSPEFEDFLGYAAILFAAVVPSAIWINSNSGGMPIFPAAALLYWVYFGVPTMRGVGESAGYSPQHVLDADLVVALFLIAGTVTWSQIFRPSRKPKRETAASFSTNKRAVIALIAIGLGMGISYYALIFSSFASLMGNANGIIRAVLLGPMVLACYFLGYGTAKKMFSGTQWTMIVTVLVAILLFQLGGQQIVTEATEVGAVLMGYTYTARRMPWVIILVMAVVISVLQAGKGEIRARYMGVTLTAQATPEMVANWFEAGIDTISNNKQHNSITDRAALLTQIIRIQQWTPDKVPYLEGETYTYLPSMLVPRIFNPNRSSSQVVMALLDVRYGFLSRDQTANTAVGVNILCEAFANFGYLGAIAIGALFGLFTGYFTRISSNREATSLPTLFAIAAMVTVLDLEADLSYLLTTFFQSSVAILALYAALRLAFGTGRPALKLKELA